MTSRPRLWLARLAACLLLPASLVLATPASAESSSGLIPQVDLALDPLLHPNEYANRVMHRINAIRAKKGLGRVKRYQGCLDHKANRWAGHLSVLGDLVHRDQQKVLKACDLHWTGETLVSGTLLSPAQAVRAWMHSKPHRAVIMKDRAELAGVGMAVSPVGVIYCVLNFGDRT